MAQIDPNTIQWDASPQTVGEPATGAMDKPLRGGVIIPPAPEKAPAPPSGYQAVDGGLAPIPGGPADPARDKPTEAQQKASTLVARIAGGFQDIENVLAKSPEAQAPGIVETMRGGLSPVGIMAPITRSIAGEERRMVYDAQRDILDALLTLGTGAAYSPEQLEAQMGAYFPQYGDTQKEADAKNNRMRRMIEAAKVNAGPLAPKLDELLAKFALPADSDASGQGPNVTVTPEQSIAAWGSATGGTPGYNEKGEIVGPDYAGELYDKDGKALGLVGTVTEEVASQSAPSFFGSLVESATGEDRTTATTERLPDWTNFPGLNDLLSSAAWKTGLGTAFGGSPQEIAQIVQSNFPGTQVWQDEKGNYILRSATDGKDYAIKPGFQISDIPRAGNIIGLGALTGGGGVARTAAMEAAAQGGIETIQSATGGTFNPADVAIAGALGGGGQALVSGAKRFAPVVKRALGSEPPPSGGGGGTTPMGSAPELPGGIQLPGGRVSAPPGGEVAGEVPPASRFSSGGAMGVSDEGIRVNRARELPVPIELGKFQRSRLFEEQQRARDLAKNNEVGGPIRDLLKNQQEALRQNFEAFLDQTGSREWGNRREQGLVVDDALRTLANRMNTKVRALYKRAEKAGEMAEPVNMDGLTDQLNTLRAERTAAPVIKGLADELAVRELATGSLEQGTLKMKRPLTLNEAEDLRKKINRVAKENDPNDLRVAGELKGLIDSLTENSGGEAYKAARAARKEVGDKFERVTAVKRILGMKPGTTDRQVALENVVDTAVTSGRTSLDDVRALKSVLDEAGPRGQRAWRELQGATLEHIRNKAYRTQTDESGQAVLYPSQLEKVITDLDKGGKLDFVFGKRNAELLRTMGEVSKDLFTAPPGAVNTSNTGSAVVNAMDTMVTFMLAGAPVPAGKLTNELFKSLRTRGLRQEVKRLIATPETP